MPLGIATQETLCEAMQPSRMEVIAAKRVALNEFRGTNPLLHAGTVLNRRLEDLGISIAPDPQERLEVREDAEVPFDRDAPALLRRRTRVAVRQAMTELVAAGVAVQFPGTNELKVPIRLVGPHGVVDDHQPVWVNTPLPAGEGRDSSAPEGEPLYAFAPRMTLDSGLEVLDSDFFVADLQGVELEVRARRCLEEALEAYRRGMYLSCVNLIGAVSEAAWYSAGEQLRDQDSALVKALDGDRTEQVLARVAEVLRASSKSRYGIEELHAHAGFLRELRNYGVHPRGPVSESQEHAFTEEATGLLILETQRYLARLAAAVQKRIGE